MRRRIKKARAQFISLVPRGANGLTCLYKSADSTVEFGPLSKFDEDKGELVSVVYAPEIRDSQGDIASAEVIKDMAYASAREGVDLDIRHDGKVLSKDRAYIAERFIIQKGDPRFQGWKNYAGQPVDVTGGWGIVAKIEDPALRKLYKDGAWNGTSLQGPAECEIEKSDIDVDAVAKALADRLNAQEQTMPISLDDLKKMFDERDAKLVAMLTKAPAPEVKKSEDFDPLNIAHVEARLATLERERITKELGALNDADALRAHRDMLVKGALISETAADKAVRLEKQVADLKATIAKAEKASAIPPKTAQVEDVVETGLSKEDADAISEGRKMAQIANASRGFAGK